MSNSLESELGYLLEIGLAIVRHGIVHMEQCERYGIHWPSYLKYGRKRDDNFLTEVSSVNECPRGSQLMEIILLIHQNTLHMACPEFTPNWVDFFRPNPL
jgi:hypothetical protein